MPEEKHSPIQRLRDAIVEWTQAYRALSRQDAREVTFRAILHAIHPVGPLIAEQYFGTKDKRGQRKIEETISFLNDRLQELEGEIQALAEYYSTDEFAALFEATWLRIMTAAQERKLGALRGALLSIITARPDLSHGKKELFVSALDRMGDLHLQVLQLFCTRMDREEDQQFIKVSDMFALVGTKNASEEQFTYSALDVLANLRFIIHGNIPRKGLEGPVDFQRQLFKGTELGAEFLAFVRVGSLAPTCGPTHRST